MTKRTISLVGLLILMTMGVGWLNIDVLAYPLALEDSAPVTVYAPSALNAVPAAPAYDSGWFALGARPDPIPIIFTHNLGGDQNEYHVSLECKDDTALSTYDCTDFSFAANAHWYAMTNTSISVWVQSSPRPDEVRVRIYTTTPDFDSDWHILLARPDPIPLPITHNLGGDPDNYWVSLECRDDTALGTYNCTGFNFAVDAHWYDLNTNAISVWIQSSPRPDEVRVRIYHVDPDYDSGWHTIGARPDPISIAFAHSLRGDPGDYLVDLQCKDNTLATYGCSDFNFNINALWYALTDTSVAVWVPGSSIPDEIRVRILAPEKVYLPIVMKN